MKHNSVFTSTLCRPASLMSGVGTNLLTQQRSFFSPQSLKQLLEEEINVAPYDSAEELGVQRKDANTDKTEFGAAEEQMWESSDPSNSALVAKQDVLTRLFKDLMRTSKRSWSRYKKGGLRSCFGVRLDRIGSFSGLGC